MTLSMSASNASSADYEDGQDTYEETLHALSEASVHKHFNPYIDIAWDSPEFAVTPGDRRWILSPDDDPIGAHPWYQEQSEERQIEIGMWRQANVAKVGLQFENILIRGMMQYVFYLPNGDAEYRYCTHECIEEGHHTLMFQEMVNRIGADTPGMGPIMRMLAAFIPLAAGPLPELFFVGVLGGEEPIDHIQKSFLRGNSDLHPIMKSVMAIHVAEEARHISFAHQFLRRRVPKMSKVGRFGLSLAMPITMRVLCDQIVIPPKSFWKRFDIPKQVRKDLFWQQKQSRKALRNYFGDVRMLAKDAGLMNPASKLVWKACKIDGDTSRFRSEPIRRVA